MSNTQEQLDPALAERIAQLHEEFDKLCRERLRIGAEHYGPAAFLERDTVTMAIEEVIDLSNYARFTFIRLMLMLDRIATDSSGIQLGASSLKQSMEDQ